MASRPSAVRMAFRYLWNFFWSKKLAMSSNVSVEVFWRWLV